MIACPPSSSSENFFPGHGKSAIFCGKTASSMMARVVLVTILSRKMYCNEPAKPPAVSAQLFVNLQSAIPRAGKCWTGDMSFECNSLEQADQRKTMLDLNVHGPNDIVPAVDFWKSIFELVGIFWNLWQTPHYMIAH